MRCVPTVLKKESDSVKLRDKTGGIARSGLGLGEEQGPERAATARSHWAAKSSPPPPPPLTPPHPLTHPHKTSYPQPLPNHLSMPSTSSFSPCLHPTGRRHLFWSIEATTAYQIARMHLQSHPGLPAGGTLLGSMVAAMPL